MQIRFVKPGMKVKVKDNAHKLLCPEYFVDVARKCAGQTLTIEKIRTIGGWSKSGRYFTCLGFEVKENPYLWAARWFEKEVPKTDCPTCGTNMYQVRAESGRDGNGRLRWDRESYRLRCPKCYHTTKFYEE